MAHPSDPNRLSRLSGMSGAPDLPKDWAPGPVPEQQALLTRFWYREGRMPTREAEN